MNRDHQRRNQVHKTVQEHMEENKANLTRIKQKVSEKCSGSCEKIKAKLNFRRRKQGFDPNVERNEQLKLKRLQTQM